MLPSPLLSVVVPIYNSENYIHKCVQSVLSQTFQDFELILVDDGSTDRSPQICDEIAINNSKVSVIHHDKNQGLLNARYTGAKNARGRYLTFVDSDDYIDSNYYEEFANVLSCYPEIDVICGGYLKEYDLKYIKLDLGLSGGYYYDESKQELNKSFFSFDYSIGTKINPSVWNKWFRCEFVLPLIERADKRITYAEDLAVSYFAIIMATNVYLLTNTTGYHYVQHNSMMTRNYPDDYFLRIQYLCDYIDNTIKDFDLHEYQAQFDRHKLLLYKRGFGTMINQKDKVPLIKSAAKNKAFRDIFKSNSLFRIRGLSNGSKFYIWMIYKNKVFCLYKLISAYSLWYRKLYRLKALIR